VFKSRRRHENTIDPSGALLSSHPVDPELHNKGLNINASLASFLFTILTAFVTTLASAVFTYVIYWRKVEPELKKEYACRFNEKKAVVYSDFADLLRQLSTPARDETVDEQMPGLTKDLHRFAGGL